MECGYQLCFFRVTSLYPLCVITYEYIYSLKYFRSFKDNSGLSSPWDPLSEVFQVTAEAFKWGLNFTAFFCAGSLSSSPPAVCFKGSLCWILELLWRAWHESPSTCPWTQHTRVYQSHCTQLHVWAKFSQISQFPLLIETFNALMPSSGFISCLFNPKSTSLTFLKGFFSPLLPAPGGVSYPISAKDQALSVWPHTSGGFVLQTLHRPK